MSSTSEAPTRSKIEYVIFDVDGELLLSFPRHDDVQLNRSHDRLGKSLY